MILCIHGSPRAHGNTDLLLESIESGAVLAGAEVQHLYCRELEIQPCSGCGACSRTGDCVLSDGMDEIYRRIDEASAIVLGAPIYFLGLPSECKRMIDRFQPRWARRYVLDQALPTPRPGAIVSTAGAPSHSVFTGGQRTAEAFFDVLNVTCRANLLYEAIDERGAVKKHPTALRDAEKLGARLAREIHQDL